jgi:SAM-dependent methyltransferase
MNPAPIRTFEHFRDAIAAYRLPRVLITALELDLFTIMNSRAWTVSELAKALQISERGLEILCRNLAMVGLLLKRGGKYRNGAFGRTALSRNSRAYRGAYLDLIKDNWSDWSQLTDCVRRGVPVDHEVPEPPDWRRLFTWAMYHRSRDLAPKVAARLNLRGARTLLDLGGGPATFALAFLAKNPGLKATVCDRPDAIEVAKEVASTHKAGARLSFLPLDFMMEPVPGLYDVIWLSNVIHIYSAEENRELLRRLLKTLAPGGRLFIHDALLHDREGLHPWEASLFAVSMLLATATGNTYHVKAVRRWLEDAGYEKVRPVPVPKEAEDWDRGIMEAFRPVARRAIRDRRTR